MTVDRLQPAADELWICQLGTVPYLDAVAMQQHLQALRQGDEIPDTLLLLEHPPVYTRGRRSREDELPLGEDHYRSLGIDVIATNRGGRVTYHGPGQLVGYPIMHIQDINSHLRTIEAAIIHGLSELGLDARSRCQEGPDYTGVWVKDRKIASIGVHVARGVTTHGFAVNVDVDLAPFSWVIPCGLPDTEMTSIARELGSPAAGIPGVEGFRPIVAESFCRAHGRRPRFISAAQLGFGDASAENAEPRERSADLAALSS
jgi:lipoyl(octanoyl) transferase